MGVINEFCSRAFLKTVFGAFTTVCVDRAYKGVSSSSFPLPNQLNRTLRAIHQSKRAACHRALTHTNSAKNYYLRAEPISLHRFHHGTLRRPAKSQNLTPHIQRYALYA